MKVSIMSMSPQWLDVIWTAARTCKSYETPDDLFVSTEIPASDKERLVLACYKAGHGSVLEHASVTFAVSGVSRALLAQYSRHRIGISLSVQSQRCVGSPYGGIVIPPSISGSDKALSSLKSVTDSIYAAYIHLTKDLKIPHEDARFILPNASCTNFVTTLNLRALTDIYDKRVRKKGAQWEIQRLIAEMARQVTEREPWCAEMFA